MGLFDFLFGKKRVTSPKKKTQKKATSKKKTDKRNDDSSIETMQTIINVDMMNDSASDVSDSGGDGGGGD